VGFDPNAIQTCYNIGNFFVFLVLKVCLKGLVFVIGINKCKKIGL
jgi:hypothetical protein